MNQIKTIIAASQTRRFVAIFMLFALGALLVYLTFAVPPETLFWQVFLFAAGAVALYGGEQLRRATLVKIELRDDKIVDSEGRVLCLLANVKAVERGAFAFKPSNGFLVRLKDPMPRAWAPGLWWRFGRMLGVGGVIAGSDAKFMAELIAMDLVKET